MPDRQKKPRKRATREYTEEELRGLQVLARICKQTRLNQDLSHAKFRGWIKHLEDLTGTTYNLGDIQRFEAGGEEHPVTGSVRDISNQYLRDICLETDLSPHNYDSLVMLRMGIYKIKQPPINELINKRINELGNRYKNELDKLDLDESKIDKARLEGNVDGDYRKLAEFLKVPNNVVLDAAISEVYKQLGFLEDYEIEDLEIEIPEFNSLKLLLTWVVDNYEFDTLQDSLLTINDPSRLTAIIEGKKPTVEELADLAYAIRQITRNTKFTPGYLKGLLDGKQLTNHLN